MKDYIGFQQEQYLLHQSASQPIVESVDWYWLS